MGSIPLKFLILPLMAGLVLGLGVYTFVYAKGYSYLSDNSETCTNCHVMQEQYRGWITGPHRQAAQCNDCHTPPGFAGKYMTKALNGFNHSWAFTTGRYPEPIRAGDRNLKIAENACLNCHGDLFFKAVTAQHRDAIHCLGCHQNAGH
jgi:cytochrome c nitrite reductase small subunit